MTYEVLSSRLSWPVGTVLSTDDLLGCNIGHLMATGHLGLAATTKKKAEPVQPEPDDYDSADEPEEQE